MAQIFNHNGVGGPVRAESAQHAAEILARREFGRLGCCHHIRLDSATRDATAARYDCRIGKPARRAGDMATARNVWIYTT